ncbi:Ribosomal-protein-S18p-alanine acetyltransferase [hydrothermal vent metagenome]|uniref:Ribosomal-protein-S18p-alanine acetyltransferase n=1 Tax=hydrothermal vent metagenome TaxID=652676 RepID=A0A3B0WWM4_9ZZZZ
MMSEFSYLDPMQEADLPWVLALEQRSYDFPWSQKGFENSLERGLSYLFYSAQGDKLGYCCLLPVLDEVQILNVCVAPEYQGKGVAKSALKTLLAKLQESVYQIVLLEVRCSNTPAIKLYQSLGFNQNGLRKNYYRVNQWNESQQCLIEEKEDALLMFLSFSNA